MSTAKERGLGSKAPSSGRIRVARIIARLNVGGPALHVTSLTARLPSDRFESRLYAGDVSPGEGEMTAALIREKVTPVRISGLGRAIRGRHDAQAVLNLVTELRRFRPHIVHTHTAKAGTLGRLAATICRVPIVVHTFHGHVFEGYFSPAKSTVFVAIERALARLTDAIVTLSPTQREAINERYRIVPRYRTYVVPLGFDLARFCVGSIAKGAFRREIGVIDAPLVTIVGRLTAIKDHPLLFEALARLGRDVHLCVVGGGEEEASLRVLSERLGLAGRIHFVGFRDDLDAILADTDVLALTSKNEGTPVAIIEGLAAGCSVVSCAVGGVADVLEGGRWGRLVPSRDPAAVAAGIQAALAEHRERSAASVDAGRSYVLGKYGVDRLVSDHVRMYDDLLRRAGIE
jgi:glycosyltransferase involved in cell wall biosynthesis